MKKIYIVALILIFSGCASVTGISSLSSRNLNLLKIETAQDDDMIVLNPGESIELEAKGFNTKGSEIEINPVWQADFGTLNPENGSNVKYTAPRDAKTGIVFIKASVDNLYDTVVVEIQR